MTEHYAGNDPETGCAYLALAACLVLVVVLLGLAWWLR